MIVGNEMLMSGEKMEHRGLEIWDCGVGEYREILARQKQLHEQRRVGECRDTVLIVEHRAVITLGARESANVLLAERSELEAKGIEVVKIRRGGGTTAHNPGQLVFYPVLRIAEFGLGISDYIRRLEGIGIELLDEMGVKCCRRKGFPGLWVGGRKIASVGVRVSKGVTLHGMAINICNDLSIFEYLVPCGLEGIEMTSVFEETGKRESMTKVKAKLTNLLLKHFCREGVSYGAK